MAIKYKQYVTDMLEIHKDLFDEFKKVHDKFEKEPNKYKKEFNEVGQKALAIIRRTENQLCSKSDAAKFGKFTNSLSDKFWAEIRMYFPKIDFVGMS